VALFDSETGKVIHRKKLLPVKEGALGLKQSDAVFHHVKQLPELVSDLFAEMDQPLKAVGVSTKPRSMDGSYMPCFLVGNLAAETTCAVAKAPKYEFSHQQGHVAAALYSCGRLDLLKQEFIAFHFSGGTTECVHVRPDEEQILSTEIIAESLDLKCGQVIDRVGNMLHMPFPSGKYLDELSQKSNKTYKVKPTFKDNNVCVSGVENQCKKRLEQGEAPEDVAKFCLESVCAIVETMIRHNLEQYPGLPLIFSGGVMSNSLIRARVTEKFGGSFAAPEFSSDNAAGIAVLAAVKAGAI
jgi:N6-L-threonylcarbamoyladenine synthase